jgi:3-oxoadipate enol-lactonase
MEQVMKTTLRSGTIHVNGVDLYYEDTGGPGEPIVFSHGLFGNTTFFDPQVRELSKRYRCISYDHRGHGKSCDVRDRVVDMDTLYADAVALIESLQLGPVHFCGHSMGGFIGMRLAAGHPELVRSLVLCSTSADPEPAINLAKYRVLNFFARWLGPRALARAVAPFVYGKTSLQDPARAAERKVWLTQLGSNHRSIWRAVNGAISRASIYGELHQIVAPTLVIVGDEDIATGPTKSLRLVDAISGAQLLTIARGGHSISIEQPAAVNAGIRGFLESALGDARFRHAPLPEQKSLEQVSTIGKVA